MLFLVINLDFRNKRNIHIREVIEGYKIFKKLYLVNRKKYHHRWSFKLSDIFQKNFHKN